MSLHKGNSLKVLAKQKPSAQKKEKDKEKEKKEKKSRRKRRKERSGKDKRISKKVILNFQ